MLLYWSLLWCDAVLWHNHTWDLTAVSIQITGQQFPWKHSYHSNKLHYVISHRMSSFLTLRLLMSYIYIYIYIYMEHLILMFLDHTRRRTTVSRTPLDEWSARRRDLYLTTHDSQQTNIHAPRWDSSPRSQQASGHRHTLWWIWGICSGPCWGIGGGMTYTIAVCTVKNSWWWTEDLCETCRVSFQE